MKTMVRTPHIEGAEITTDHVRPFAIYRILKSPSTTELEGGLIVFGIHFDNEAKNVVITGVMIDKGYRFSNQEATTKEEFRGTGNALVRANRGSSIISGATFELVHDFYPEDEYVYSTE